MNRKFLSLLLIVLLLALASPGCSQRTVKLAYAAKVGETLRYKTVYDIVGSTTVPGKGVVPMNMHMETIIAQKVTEVESNDTVVIETTYESATVKADGKEIPFPYEDKSFTIVMTKQGKILEVRGLEKLSLGAINENDYKKMMQELQPEFPDKELRIGDTWSIEKKIELPQGFLEITASSVLGDFKNIEGFRCAIINTEFSIPLTMQEEKQGIKIKMSGEEEGTGTTYFAVKEGKLVKAEVDISAHFTTSITPPPGSNLSPEQSEGDMDAKMTMVLLK